jgi:sec-independent protein translocase protein TatA
MMPGWTELLLIAAVVFLLFGAGRIPGIMENMAKGVKAFKKGLADDDAKPLPPKDHTKDDNKPG